MTDADTVLAALRERADPGRAAEMAAYHKAPRVYLGVAVPEIEALVADWRGRPVAERVALARALWDSDVHEARIAAAKLLTQARIREGESLVWAEFLRWLPDFDAWAIADHACKVGERRLATDPARLDAVGGLDGGCLDVGASRSTGRDAAVGAADASGRGRAGGARADPRLGGGLRHRPRLVHPESGGVVAPDALGARSGAG